MKTAFVWPVEPPAVDLETDVFVGTHYLATICDLDYLWWLRGKPAPDSVKRYDCLIVNLFGGSQQVTQIRTLNPNAFIIALPDNAFEQIFTHDSTNDMLFLEQIQAADAIGYISESNRQFYGAMFPDKPTVKIPMPIGNSAFFADCRKLPKTDTIITCDHLILGKDGKPILDASSIQNVAACTAIQRATGLHVIYVNAAPKTEEYAKIAGLKATFTAYLNFATYAELAAKARLGVDAYSLHGFGRNTLMYAYVGTPAFGSIYTEYAANMNDPWNPIEFAEYVDNYLSVPAYYKSSRQMQIDFVEQEYSFDACRKQMTAVLNEVESWHLLPMGKS